MVQYYRTLVGKDTVYREDGTLDIEANAKIVEENGKAEKEALNPDRYGMQLNRYLAKMLIDCLITNDANVDPETANLAIGAPEKGAVSQKASQGTIAMTKSNQNDNGRSNRIKVTYTDKDGVDHVEYYNYLYKSKKYDDEIDVENGAIYLALIKYDDESGKWETSAVEDENNFDDYNKLTKALQAIEDLEKYEKAREAVDEAMEKVTTLEEMIASLSIESPSNLSKLEDALAQAKEELDEATVRKQELEGIVEEARVAVAGINLSRFDVSFTEDEEEHESSGSSSAADNNAVPIAATEEVSATQPTFASLPTIPVAIAPTIPEVTPIAGLTAESPFADITLARTMQEARETENNLLSMRYSPLPAAVTPEDESVLLDEPELAGANAIAEDTKQKHWWAWLFAVLASFFGFLFVKKKEEQQEENKAKKES